MDDRQDLGIGSWPERRARITPARTALVSGEQSWSYADLASRVGGLAAGLRAAGVAPGDRVAYLGVNSPAFLETLFAVGRLGAVFVPLNTRLSPVELAYMLADCGADLLVHGEESAALAAAAVEQRAVATVVAVDGEAPGGLTYASLVQTAADPTGVDVSLDDPCMIIYTSGTTGRPKGAVISHGNVTWNLLNQLAHVDVLSTDVALAVAPLFHTAGLNQVTLPTLFKGGTVVVVPRFDPGELLRTVAERGITAFAAVPTILQVLCEHPDFAATDLSSLRHVVYGGSPVAAHVAEAWLDRGVPLLQGYGMTEASPGVVMAVREGAAEQPVSTGPPHFFTDLALLVDDEVVPARDATGELLVRGPNVFSGYWDRPRDTRDAFVDGRWFRTGDAVRVGPDGWTHVVDRIKDMYISGGENVYPAEVEAVLERHPAVQACAVVGVPDERWGEVGVAWVVRRSGAALDEAEVLAHLAGELARYKVPRGVQFVDALPTNAVGKVRRVELKQPRTAQAD